MNLKTNKTKEVEYIGWAKIMRNKYVQLLRNEKRIGISRPKILMTFF